MAFQYGGLVGFEIIERETDLYILADKNLEIQANLSVIKRREELQKFILDHETFGETFSPYSAPINAPSIIRDMAWASVKANVGPMAAVAGAIAEKIGRDLLKKSKEIIVQNGRDIFLKVNKPCRIPISAGNSSFAGKITLEIDPEDAPCGICTSSGTHGHSISLGKSDAVIVIAKSAALADAAATAIGNVVQDTATITKGLETAKKIKGLKGVLILKDDQMGIIGKVRIIPISHAV